MCVCIIVCKFRNISVWRRQEMGKDRIGAIHKMEHFEAAHTPFQTTAVQQIQLYIYTSTVTSNDWQDLQIVACCRAFYNYSKSKHQIMGIEHPQCSSLKSWVPSSHTRLHFDFRPVLHKPKDILRRANCSVLWMLQMVKWGEHLAAGMTRNKTSVSLGDEALQTP